MVRKRLLGRGYFGVLLVIKALHLAPIFRMKKSVPQSNLLRQMAHHKELPHSIIIELTKIKLILDNTLAITIQAFRIMQMSHRLFKAMAVELVAIP